MTSLARCLVADGRGLSELIERHAVDPFGGQHPSAAQLGHQFGNPHPRVALEPGFELGDVAGFDRVVEFLTHPFAQFVDEPLGVETLEHHRREHRVHHLGGVEIALDRLVHSRVLHLHRDIATVVGDRAMDLADRCSGHGHVRPVEEEPFGRFAEVALHHVGGEGRCHRCRVGLQGGERFLRLVGECFEDETDELARLHQHALHLAEFLGDVLGGADGELLVELRPPLLGRPDATNA